MLARKRSIEDNLTNLRQQASRLSEDITNLASQIVASGHENAESSRRRVHHLVESSRDALHRGKQSLEKRTHDLATSLRNRQSKKKDVLLLAGLLGAGMLLAGFLGKKR